jgi:hypothetical protein
MMAAKLFTPISIWDFPDAFFAARTESGGEKARGLGLPRPQILDMRQVRCDFNHSLGTFLNGLGCWD